MVTADAGMEASSVVALFTILVTELPPKTAWEDPLTKLVPVIVRVKPAAPAVTAVGLSAVIAGPWTTVKIWPGDAVTPSLVVTVTVAVPAAVRAAAGTDAFNCVVLTKVVGSAPLPNVTVVELVKPVPVTVMVKPGEPTEPALGLMAVTAGTGLTIRLTALDATESNETTLMGTVPAAARSAAPIETVAWVGLTKLVGRLAPLTVTVEPCRKLAPVTVRVNPLDVAVRAAGFRLVMVGAGLTVKFTVFEEAPSLVVTRTGIAELG